MPVLRIPVGRYPLFLGDLAVTVEIHTTVAVFDDATVPFLLEALSIAPGGGWVARPMVVESVSELKAPSRAFSRASPVPLMACLLRSRPLRPFHLSGTADRRHSEPVLPCIRRIHDWHTNIAPCGSSGGTSST